MENIHENDIDKYFTDEEQKIICSAMFEYNKKYFPRLKELLRKEIRTKEENEEMYDIMRKQDEALQEVGIDPERLRNMRIQEE